MLGIRLAISYGPRAPIFAEESGTSPQASMLLEVAVDNVDSTGLEEMRPLELDGSDLLDVDTIGATDGTLGALPDDEIVFDGAAALLAGG